MSDLTDLIRQRTTQGEAALRTALHELTTTGLVRDYLPQTWGLATEKESLVIHVDLDGRMTIAPGTSLVRDGTISMPHDLLVESIRTAKNPPASSYKVTFHTDRGRAAFELLASFFDFR